MDGAPTVLNIADLGTKRLAKARRDFLMFLIGLVEYDQNSKAYVPVGEDAFNSYLQKIAIGKTMKSVRQVMLKSLTDGVEDLQIKVSKPMVKAVTSMALQPLVSSARLEEINYDLMVRHYTIAEFFLERPWFMLSFALVFMVMGIIIGYYLKMAIRKIELSKVLSWAMKVIGEKEELTFVDDWDPVNMELRQYRVLQSADDADDAMSGEEYFRECPGRLARFVKLDRKRRRKYGIDETDPLDAYDMTSDEEAEEEEMEVDETLPAVAEATSRMAHAELSGADSVAGGGDGAPANGAATTAVAARSNSDTREYMSSLPGSPASESPTLPTIGVNWENLGVLLEHMPPSQRERARRVQEGGKIV